MEVKKVFIDGHYELLLTPEDDVENWDLLDVFRAGDVVCGECKKEAHYIYPELILRKGSR